MFILYTDASGTPEISGDTHHYVMVGVCVHEGTWFALDKRVRALKRKYALAGADFELHAMDFCCTIHEQDDIDGFESLNRTERRRRVLELRAAKLRGLNGASLKARLAKNRRTESFVHLSRLERSRLFEEALDLVATHEGVRLFGEIADKQYAFRKNGQQDAMKATFTQVVTRFDRFLSRYNALGSAVRPENGILLMDREPTYEARLAAIMSAYRDSGHPWGELKHVIEAPCFVDSSSVSAVQIVDLCAYAVRRYVERWEKHDSAEEQNFLRIYPLFDRERARLHGLRHYCEAGSCGCRVCRDRRHDAHFESRVRETALARDDTVRRPTLPSSDESM